MAPLNTEMMYPTLSQPRQVKNEKVYREAELLTEGSGILEGSAMMNLAIN